MSDTKTNKSIMSERGGIIATIDSTSTSMAFITFLAVDVEGNTTSSAETLSNILAVKAPADSIVINKAVDYNVSKTLDGNYVIATFGYQPITISISGLDLYNICAEATDNSDAKTIQAFFDAYNVHANKKYRILVGMNDSSGQSSYNCIMVSLVRSTDKSYVDAGMDGVGKYTMQLIGAPIA